MTTKHPHVASTLRHTCTTDIRQVCLCMCLCIRTWPVGNQMVTWLRARYLEHSWRCYL